jgi:hypothetical protein
MRRFIPLLLAAILSLPSIAGASASASRLSSGGTKWALFGLGSNRNRAKKAPKAPKAKRSRKAGKPLRRAKSSR